MEEGPNVDGRTDDAGRLTSNKRGDGGVAERMARHPVDGIGSVGEASMHFFLLRLGLREGGVE